VPIPTALRHTYFLSLRLPENSFPAVQVTAHRSAVRERDMRKKQRIKM